MTQVWRLDSGRAMCASLPFTHWISDSCGRTELQVHVCRTSQCSPGIQWVVEEDCGGIGWARTVCQASFTPHVMSSMPFMCPFTDGKTEARSAALGHRRHPVSEAILVINGLPLGIGV